MGHPASCRSGGEVFGEDEVAALLGTYEEGAGSGFGETVAAVEGDGSVVGGVGSEEEARAVEGAGVGDGRVHEGLAGALGGVDDGGAAEAGEEVDSLELDVGGEGGDAGKLGCGEHGEAYGGVWFDVEAARRAGEGEGDTRVGVLEVGGVGFGGVIFGGVREDVGSGKHPGEGFEEGSCTNEGEHGCVCGCGAAEGYGFDGVDRRWGGSAGFRFGFDGVNGHGNSRKGYGIAARLGA